MTERYGGSRIAERREICRNSPLIFVFCKISLMAGSSFDDGIQKHQKVYSFLKRTLPQDRYEGLRVIEPCVIVTDGFNRTFQFAVLGDEMLYITENPPKTSKDIRIKVDLACVTSVELVSFVLMFI